MQIGIGMLGERKNQSMCTVIFQLNMDPSHVKIIILSSNFIFSCLCARG